MVLEVVAPVVAALPAAVVPVAPVVFVLALYISRVCARSGP